MATLTDDVLASADLAEVLASVADHTRRVSDLCDLLEAVADDLPRKAKPVWREIIRLCDAILMDHFNTFAQIIVPALLRRTKDDANWQTVLTQLKTEYSDESSRVPELSALLADNIGADENRMEPETLGYALRSFFNALRRQAAWERNVLLPLASDRLQSGDLAEIADELSRTKRSNIVDLRNLKPRGNS